MDAKHTPGPWTWDGRHRAIRVNQQIIAMIGDLCLDSQWPEDAANAAFICRACNCHDELLEAVVDLLDQLEAIGIPDWHGAEGLSLDQARAAIASATSAGK